MSSLPVPDRRRLVEAPIDVSHVEALIDRFGPVRLTVLGLPSQARLTAGRLNYDGSWTVRSNELAGLAVRAPKDLPEFDIELVPELEPDVGAPALAGSNPVVRHDTVDAGIDDWEPEQPADPQSWIESRNASGPPPAPAGRAASGGSWVAALDG